MNDDPKKPVSLEDLLHLKRSERPPEQFWVQFESQLRAKQLAAIVQHRPWWASSERFFRLLARQSLPIGATAVLALGLLSFQQYRVHSARPEMAIPAAPTATTFKSETAIAPDADESTEAAPEQTVATAASEPMTTSAPVAAVRPAPVEVAAGRSRPTASAAALVADNGTDPFSALVGSPQKNVAAVPVQSDAWSHFGDQQLANNSLAATVGFVPRSFATGASEPLAHMASPSDERRAMLLGGSLPRSENAAPDNLLSPDARMASRLSDERLYESVRRYGLGGNQISVRF